eukprot:CAMPEP_0115194020 /NCGR_PEP_ID=MMETSP0270-20121206/13859_1 /TAXON_ID=71861 /ORGANISM="Scrippsiella trochoidea, Strain CCMP3099" /LENGTH=326 /DNA_ID=CAMNT_0002607317 /DNA_START=15 /DNA_END=992 /DNA_ORIENTATION=-
MDTACGGGGGGDTLGGECRKVFKSWRCRVLSGMNAILLIIGYTASPMLFWAIEGGERAWRDSPAHWMINQLANDTMIHHHHWRPWAIIFFHIPRTGGDALMTHLFPTDDAWLGRSWWKDGHMPRFYEELEASGQLQWSSPSRKSLFKGFLSGDDYLRLKEGPWKEHWGKVRTFIILRDPVERVLSAVKHMKKYGVHLCGDAEMNMLHGDRSKCQDNRLRRLQPRKLRQARPTLVEEKLQSYLHNAVAYQLGDHLNVSLRHRSPEEAVARAKEVLRSIDFLGFYEDWGAENKEDSAQFTKPEEVALLKNLTYYDQQVYEFARSLKGR